MEIESFVSQTAMIVIVNSLWVGLAVVGISAFLGSAELTTGKPGVRQNIGEAILQFFVDKARAMGHGEQRARVVRLVAPVLATFFLFIFLSNLVGIIPIPHLNMPPTAYFGATLGLAISSVIATLALSAIFKGPAGAAKHLVWPNPMQWVSEFTDVLSLSLRLFGNIGGEHMTIVLVTGVVAYGIPLVLHVLGFIPAFVQALVFTLLTASFMSSAIHKEEKSAKRRSRRATATVGTPSEGGI